MTKNTENTKLKKYREKLGDDQYKIAKKIGISQPHYSRIETGFCPPGNKTAKKIVDFTGGKITYDDLYGGSHAPR